jgi:hypothetical protein
LSASVYTQLQFVQLLKWFICANSYLVADSTRVTWVKCVPSPASACSVLPLFCLVPWFYHSIGGFCMLSFSPSSGYRLLSAPSWDSSMSPDAEIYTSSMHASFSKTDLRLTHQPRSCRKVQVVQCSLQYVTAPT